MSSLGCIVPNYPSTKGANFTVQNPMEQREQCAKWLKHLNESIRMHTVTMYTRIGGLVMDGATLSCADNVAL